MEQREAARIETWLTICIFWQIDNEGKEREIKSRLDTCSALGQQGFHGTDAIDRETDLSWNRFVGKEKNNYL